MTNPETKEVELRHGTFVRRVQVPADASPGHQVRVPWTPGPDGYSQMAFRPTDQRTSDGLEVWSPQPVH